jgi:hypothetical protein
LITVKKKFDLHQAIDNKRSITIIDPPTSDSNKPSHPAQQATATSRRIKRNKPSIGATPPTDKPSIDRSIHSDRQAIDRSNSSDRQAINRSEQLLRPTSTQAIGSALPTDQRPRSGCHSPHVIAHHHEFHHSTHVQAPA